MIDSYQNHRRRKSRF